MTGIRPTRRDILRMSAGAMAVNSIGITQGRDLQQPQKVRSPFADYSIKLSSVPGDAPIASGDNAAQSMFDSDIGVFLPNYPNEDINLRESALVVAGPRGLSIGEQNSVDKYEYVPVSADQRGIGTYIIPSQNDFEVEFSRSSKALEVEIEGSKYIISEGEEAVINTPISFNYESTDGGRKQGTSELNMRVSYHGSRDLLYHRTKRLYPKNSKYGNLAQQVNQLSSKLGVSSRKLISSKTKVRHLSVYESPPSIAISESEAEFAPSRGIRPGHGKGDCSCASQGGQ